MTDTIWDVAVVGAGPAGSTVAALLARAGHRVLLVDKDPFPRFHIGESLLPLCLPVLERLGVRPDPACYVYKRGAQFVCERTGRVRAFDFADALPGPPRHAWQVERAGFDKQLMSHALALGATLRSGVKITSVEIGEDLVSLRAKDEVLRARYLVDASGQNRLMARKHKSAVPLLRFGRTAAFVHFSGLSDAALEEIGEGNDIRIMVVGDGWGWVIPLAGRRLSTGLVCREGRVAAHLVERYIAESALITRWTRGCTRTGVQVERNFSFTNTRSYGPRFVCVGDAACFLDPVFSSGVSLAMVGAQSVADRLSPALASGSEAAPELMAEHRAYMEKGYRVFSSMIDRFYNTRFMEHFIFGAHEPGRIENEIVSILAGDVWRDDNAFARMLTTSRRSGTS